MDVEDVLDEEGVGFLPTGTGVCGGNPVLGTATAPVEVVASACANSAPHWTQYSVPGGLLLPHTGHSRAASCALAELPVGGTPTVPGEEEAPESVAPPATCIGEPHAGQ